jgi:hypothetical protein
VRAALVAMLVWAAASAVSAEHASRVDGGVALEYCARVVSAGADAIDPEARRLGLDLGAWQSAGDMEALRGVVGSFLPAEARARAAEFVDGRVIVDESAENCFVRGGDPALIQRLQDANGAWQFAFEDRFTRSAIFDWHGVAGGRSVRAMRLGLTRRDPIPLTAVSPAPVDVPPRVSDAVRVAWVRHVMDVCTDHAHRGALPGMQDFEPYLIRDVPEEATPSLRSAPGQPQARLFIGARDGTCSVISSGEHGRLLTAAVQADLVRRGATQERGAFRLSAPVAGMRDADVLVAGMVAGQHLFFIAPH